MSRLGDTFAKAHDEKRAVLVAYLPAGFPTVDLAAEAMERLVAAGVDIVEVGLPYSDPLMDGPVIQSAVEQARKLGTTTKDVIETVRRVAATGASALVMSYWNPIERYGVDRFATDLAAAGGAGVITPDLTPDEAGDWLAAVAKSDLDPIFLVAPSSTEARLRLVSDHTQGFVYAASTMGVTGTRDAVGSRAEELVRRTRAVTDKPIAVGLGVSNGAQAAEVAGFADGVIVGSAFVRCLLDAPSPKAGLDALDTLAAELVRGVRGVR